MDTTLTTLLIRWYEWPKLFCRPVHCSFLLI